MPTPVAPPGSEQRPARQPVNVARWISLLCLAGAALVLAYLAFGYPPRAAVYDGQNAVFATGEVTAVWPLIKGRRGFLQTYAALVYYTDAEGRLRRVAAPYQAAQGERLALG